MKPGPSFDSFEALRIRPREHLDSIEPRSYARLQFKRATFVILREPDFQALERASDFGHLERAVQVLEAALGVLTDSPDTRLVMLTAQAVRRELNGLHFHAGDAGQGIQEASS
ncbi:hypothetical protein [Deinococcus sp. QL22]|uniref:hypothetical protein n=1 Tax=Deinococcus sp. QL22 TaxID=2939437 RepID=UPI002017C4E1|nr:hypothetical protein [Deinococcus sp. QL22]UQN10398.1 hypothetical protein M1R55_30050 [Deinococcus sp. QL22]UQN10532.1 hypothetical protein M1R55_29375 [Deinococcus sp. QL22]